MAGTAWTPQKSFAWNLVPYYNQAANKGFAELFLDEISLRLVDLFPGVKAINVCFLDSFALFCIESAFGRFLCRQSGT